MIEDVRIALRELPTLQAGAELRERIVSSRAAGARVVLPAGDLPSRRAARWFTVGIAATAAALAFGLLERRSGQGPGARGVIDRDDHAELLRGTPLWPAPGAAQESRATHQGPKYALIVASRLDVSRLQAGTWTYESRTTTDEVLTQTTGRIRVTLTRGRDEGRAVWVTHSAREGPQGWGGFPDTAYLDPVTLRPLKHTLYGYKNRIRILQSFSSDSGWEAIDRSGPPPRSSRSEVALPFPRDAAFVTNWFLYDLRIIAPTLTLTRGWRGSVYQVWWLSFPDRFDAFVPVDLRVVGRDRVIVPAGTFDCWRLEVQTTRVRAPERFRMWVARDQGWVVKTEHRGTDFRVEEVLQSHETATPAAPR
jgi:hypothetical protein